MYQSKVGGKSLPSHTDCIKKKEEDIGLTAVVLVGLSWVQEQMILMEVEWAQKEEDLSL
jgi:hypothetical protein